MKSSFFLWLKIVQLFNINFTRRGSFIWRTVPFCFIYFVFVLYCLPWLVEIRPGTWNKLRNLVRLFFFRITIKCTILIKWLIIDWLIDLGLGGYNSASPWWNCPPDWRWTQVSNDLIFCLIYELWIFL